MDIKNLNNSDLDELTQDFAQQWRLDPIKQTISRTPTSNWTAFLEFIGLRRKTFPIKILYRFVRKQFHDNVEKTIVIPYPFANVNIHDIYKLANGWTIPLKDRKYLTNGPLFDSDGKTILITEKQTFFLDKRWVRIIITIFVLLNIFVALGTKLYGLYK